MKKYKIAVVFGRYQILHNGHMECLKKAFEVAEHVLIFVGSANVPRTVKNPFDSAERAGVIDSILQASGGAYEIYSLNDYPNDNPRWKKQITDVVGYETSVCVVGGSKGEWYYDLFPEYDVMLPEHVLPINATDIRENYYTYDDILFGDAQKLPVESILFLENFRKSSWYAYLRMEHVRIKALNDQYGKGPFFTVDNVIVHKGRVLLIKRKNHPGKDLWAIPGGYFDVTDKSLHHGCLRELKEETHLNIQDDQFDNWVGLAHIFDDPNRSNVARLITYASYLPLPDDFKPEVMADDDAAIVFWFSLSEVANMRHLMYDDHYEIIEYFTNFEERVWP